MIGDGLKARYEAPKKLSHELFVLMLQLKEQERCDSNARQEKAVRKKSLKAATQKAARVSL